MLRHEVDPIQLLLPLLSRDYSFEVVVAFPSAASVTAESPVHTKFASIPLNSYSNSVLWEVHRTVAVDIETDMLPVVDIAHLDLASYHGVGASVRDTAMNNHSGPEPWADASAQEDTEVGIRSKHLEACVVAFVAADNDFRWAHEKMLVVSFAQSLQTLHTLN